MELLGSLLGAVKGAVSFIDCGRQGIVESEVLLLSRCLSTDVKLDSRLGWCRGSWRVTTFQVSVPMQRAMQW